MGAATTTIDLIALHKEIAAKLRSAELQAAALRGQLALIERMVRESQIPVMSGEPLGEREA